MNSEQYRFLDKNKLSINMIFALASLVEEEALTYCGQSNFGRQFSALKRRGLLTEMKTVTVGGENIYREYCQLGETPLEYSRRLDKEIKAQLEAHKSGTLCPTCGQPAFGRLSVAIQPSPLSKIPVASTSSATVIEDDLGMVIDCWDQLPMELRRLISDAAFRTAGG